MSTRFGTSGIRGIYGTEVTEEVALHVGLALGTELKKGTVLLGRDARTTSLSLENALAAGIASAGLQTQHTGLVPTPVLAWNTRELKADAGAMITASHNPAEYNGIKLWNSDSSAYRRAQEEKIEMHLEKEEFTRADWKAIQGSETVNAISPYLEALQKKYEKTALKLIVDCGGGAACNLAPSVFDAEFIFETFDPFFKGRASEPAEKNLGELKKAVSTQKAALGIAFDGDADRLALIDEKGRFVPKDALLALLARHALAQKKGTIAIPIDTSRAVQDVVEASGGLVVMTRVGDVAVAEALKKEKGVFGGEPSGSFIFPDFSYCPDPFVSALEIIALLSETHSKLSVLVEELPEYVTLRETIACKNADKDAIVKKIAERAGAIGEPESVSREDGVRLDFEDAWILVRASGTEPFVRITVESQDKNRAAALLKSLQ